MVHGTLIAESLAVGSTLEVEGLQVSRILRRDVSSSATDAQPEVWTLIEFRAAENRADEIAAALSGALLAEGGWYADFTARDQHCVVFADRVFWYRRGDAQARAEAEAYGRSVGVPAHQLDWSDEHAAPSA